VLYKAVWLLQSKKTTGVFAFESYGPALDQIRFPYSIIYFLHGKDTVWFKGPGHLQLKAGDKVPVRYLSATPTQAKLDTFKSIWIGTIIYGGIPLLVLLVICLHPEIVPYKAKIILTRKSPFVRLLPGSFEYSNPFL
ncbi:MAG TPA: DUF3592 domain-containing protein, partial [Niastella sp.]